MKLLTAVDEDWNIGYEGKLPWHNSDELKLFKERTFGNFCVFGYNTAVKLPELKGRGVFVLTSRYPTGTHCKIGNNKVSITKIENLESFKFLENLTGIDVFICGGRTLYEYVLKERKVEECIITRMSGTYKSDTTFPLQDLEDGYSFSKILERYDDFIIESWRKK